VTGSLRGPRIAGLVLLVLGAVVLRAVWTIADREEQGFSPVGPRFVPIVVAVGLIVLSVAFLYRSTLSPDTELAEQSAAEDANTNWVRTGAALVVLFAYALLLDPLGYIIATTLLFAAMARVLGSRDALRDLCVGLALAAVVYWAFTTRLGVLLPDGILGL
jgi:putative tricarboxylic transport membrane protein